MKVIFLDFDGVMDTGFYDGALENEHKPTCDKYGAIFDPISIQNLDYIIRRTNASIVVSSDWKYFMSKDNLQAMWKARRLPGKIIDTTPNCSRHRGDEISQWLSNNSKVIEYAIIDDLGADCFNDSQLPHLVCVNPYNGLDLLSANRVIKILNTAYT